MNAAESLPTLDALRDLGFGPDDEISFSSEGLSFDFGSLKLSATPVVNQRFVEVISTSAIYATQKFQSSVVGCWRIRLRITPSLHRAAGLVALGIENLVRGDRHSKTRRSRNIKFPPVFSRSASVKR
jgi:hypothetical protein